MHKECGDGICRVTVIVQILFISLNKISQKKTLQLIEGCNLKLPYCLQMKGLANNFWRDTLHTGLS